MNSSTSSSDPSVCTQSNDRAGAPRARLFLACLAGGLAVAAAVATLLPESWIHTPPEYGMAEAFEDHIEAACAARAAPELLIIGDSRAVAGVSVREIRAAGIEAEKFALGGAGVFAGWAVLDRLVACGVRPRHVVMAYGTGHILDKGALMDRTANYDVLKGPRAAHAYDMASQWEDSLARRLTYKAMSFVGADLTLVDIVLLRPALRNVLEKPPVAARNHAVNEEERAEFLASLGDRYYGRAEKTSDLPDEKQYGPEQAVPLMTTRATQAVAELGRTHGFDVSFYILPLSYSARDGLHRELFATVTRFRDGLPAMGVRPLNDVWFLPDEDFGDPSHVNARGRAQVTPDFIARFASVAGELSTRRGADETHHAVALPAQHIEQARK